MRRFTFILAIASIAFGLTACNNNKAPVEPDKPVTGGSGNSEQTAGPKEPVPDTLKHEGFKYYGLEEEDELTYEFDLDGSKREGKQKQTYNGLVDGKPQFSIERAEALSALGTEIVEVREDGVYIVSSRGGTLEKALLALPAKLETGKTWDIDQTMKDPDGQEVKMKATSKIEGQEKVKTPGGEFDCMVISMEGSLDSQGKTHKVSGKTWFAAGIGTVKLTVTRIPSGEEKPSTYTITLSKPPSAQ